jgi:hypothetical protein
MCGPQRHRLASHLAVAFAAICVTACMDVQHPPASWGNITPAVQAEDCASLAATYGNHGERSDGLAVLLTGWLFPRNAPTRGIDKDLIGAQTVTLELDGALLTVKINGPEGAYHQWSYDKSKHEFGCRNGVLSIFQGGDLSGQNIAALGADSIDLYRTQGELFVNAHGSSAGIALMIPMAQHWSGWGRFQVEASGLSRAAPPQ